MKAVRNPPVRYIPSLLKPYDSFVWGNLNSTELIALKSCIVFMTPVRTQLHSLKKGASWCHRRTFLSKWFHKEPLTSEETFCFTKVYLWQKKGSSDYKKLRNRWFFNLWTFDFYGSLWNQKWFFNGIAVKNLLSTFIFNVTSLILSCCHQTKDLLNWLLNNNMHFSLAFLPYKYQQLHQIAFLCLVVASELFFSGP